MDWELIQSPGSVGYGAAPSVSRASRARLATGTTLHSSIWLRRTNKPPAQAAGKGPSITALHESLCVMGAVTSKSHQKDVEPVTFKPAFSDQQKKTARITTAQKAAPTK